MNEIQNVMCPGFGWMDGWVGVKKGEKEREGEKKESRKILLLMS